MIFCLQPQSIKPVCIFIFTFCIFTLEWSCLLHRLFKSQQWLLAIWLPPPPYSYKRTDGTLCSASRSGPVYTFILLVGSHSYVSVVVCERISSCVSGKCLQTFLLYILKLPLSKKFHTALFKSASFGFKGSTVWHSYWPFIFSENLHTAFNLSIFVGFLPVGAAILWVRRRR